MEETIIDRWLKREGITLKANSDKVDTHLYVFQEINPIAVQYAIYSGTKMENVSIGDIYGFAEDSQTTFQGMADNIIDELDMLFNENMGEYSSRSNSLLDVPKEQLLDILGESFIKDPIRIDEVEEGRCIVNGNGKHRYTLLRCLYLNELSQIDCNDKNAIKKLKDKYKIPALVNKVDLRKTYIKMFLMVFGFNKIRSVNFDSNFLGKNCVEIEHVGEGIFSSCSQFIPDDELMSYVSKIIRDSHEVLREKEHDDHYELEDEKYYLKIRKILNANFIKELPQYFREIQSFREFVVENLREVFLEESVKRNIEIGVGDEENIKETRSTHELNKISKTKSDPRD